jgi:hypothetical protein
MRERSMRVHAAAALFAVGMLGPSAAALAAPVLIDFDTDPIGNPIEDGTAVDLLYAGIGVTFEHEGDASCGANVYANADRPGGFGSAPNVVSTCQLPFESDIDAGAFGVIHAALSQPASRVCVDVRPNGPTHFARLRVFDAGGVEIGAAVSAPGVSQTLCVDAAGIRGARFAGGAADAFARFDNFAVTFSDTVCSPTAGPGATSLVASVLPSSRSVQVGATATVFASVINTGTAPACGVGLSLPSGIVADFKYNETVCSTNLVKGADDTPVNVAPGEVACFVISIRADGSFDPSELGFNVSASNAAPVEGLDGINTLLMSAEDEPVPDMVALAATLANDGIVRVPGPPGTGVFAVATSNLGAASSITATANTGDATLPVALLLCQTNPGTGECISAIGSSVTAQVDAGATPTFGVFVSAASAIALNPAMNRVFVMFGDGTGAVRGRTSVAVSAP